MKFQQRVMSGMDWCRRNGATTEDGTPCTLLQVALMRNRQLMVDGVKVEKSGDLTDTPGKPGLLQLGQLLGEFAERQRRS